MSSNEDYYNAVGAWFLGTRGENADVIGELFQTVLRYQVDARRRFHPNDESPYTNNMMSSQAFGDSIEKLREIINTLAPQLAGSAIPFFSPRYIAHMSMDVSMPGLVGYLLTMMFNQNNVAIEASPLTTSIEITVGKELAELVGYSTNTTVNPVGWGHITCDGSVANLESVWAARNLKFYPLSLYNAMKDELRFVADTFEVPTAQGETKLLRNFSTWELLNITPHDVLDLPTRLGDQYGITPSFLGNVMHKYVIQTVGKDSLEKQFNIQLSGHALASATMHYSWPKAAAVTGIGSDNMVGIKVDDRARMSIPDLRAHLDKCISEQRFVYMVTAIIGTTEHGAADPLHEIELLRREYQQKGLSFVIHADGAWGGYFASMVSPELRKQTLERLGLGKKGAAIPSLPRKQRDSFVPTAPLNDHTLKAIVCLQFADSITIDPHKSGYVQYPAGGLLYRDQRMRYLVTWTSPIVFRDTEESIGIYGIEGSKPGAAPVAVWCSHQVIGLNTHGYGQVLGQAMFGGIKMYAHLATMSTDDDPFIVITMNKLPAEENNEGPEKIAEQKKEIREKILNVSNRDLFNDKEAWALATSLGSDLTINAFAVNFKINGHVNTDIVEANYLNTRIFNRVSIVNVETEEQLNKKPLILTSTVLSKDAYGLGLTQFKNRLHLYDGGDLYTLVNVVMSPFPTIDNLMEDIAASLKQVIQEELQVSLFRNTLTPDLHGFVMQGTEQIYLVHLAMFYMENHRMQLVITGDLDSTTLQKYRDSKKDNEGTVYILGTSNKTTLETILKDKEFDVDVFKGFPSDTNPPLSSGKLSNIQVVVQRDLHTSSLTPYPPRTMPFSLYGSIEHGWHIDHIYTSAPNIQLSGESVQFDQSIFKNHAAISPSSHIYAHFDLPESAMQPFASDAGSETNPTFFKPGAVFHNVRITTGEDPYSMWYGNVDLTLGKAVFVDAQALNDNPEPEVHSHAAHAANVATKATKHFCLPEPKPRQERKWLNIVEQAGTGIRSAKAKAK